MSFVKLLPAWLHAVADYAVGILLIIVALAAGQSGLAKATGVIVGSVVLLVSMATQYPLGVVKILSFRLHSLGDYAAAGLLFVAPFALRFNSAESPLSIFYIAVGAAVLGVSLITNYQYSETPQAAVVPSYTETPSPRRTRPLRAATR